jgi:hypothetical protein
MQNKTIFTSKSKKIRTILFHQEIKLLMILGFFFEKCFSNSLLSSYLINKQINKVTFLNTV